MSLRSRHVQRVQKLCAARGLKITQAGQGWRITGRGISILAADLSFVTRQDLRPVAMKRVAVSATH